MQPFDNYVFPNFDNKYSVILEFMPRLFIMKTITCFITFLVIPTFTIAACIYVDHTDYADYGKNKFRMFDKCHPPPCKDTEVIVPFPAPGLTPINMCCPSELSDHFYIQW
ncbi:hypothetical protein RMATCC62417_04199 [Rhizopus microsporus]|nr:hypothetical protein RMATCC62417_04199 [Rhizopus microsporus]